MLFFKEKSHKLIENTILWKHLILKLSFLKNWTNDKNDDFDDFDEEPIVLARRSNDEEKFVQMGIELSSEMQVENLGV